MASTSGAWAKACHTGARVIDVNVIAAIALQQARDDREGKCRFITILQKEGLKNRQSSGPSTLQLCARWGISERRCL
jgi:hypothetical protein